MRDFGAEGIDGQLDILRENLSDLQNETLWLLDFRIDDPAVVVSPLSLEPCRLLVKWILEETPPLLMRLHREEPQPQAFCEHILQLCADLRRRHPTTDPMAWSATLSICSTIASLIDEIPLEIPREVSNVGSGTPLAREIPGDASDAGSDPPVARASDSGVLAPGERAQNRFVLEGDHFRIRYGSRAISLNNTVGLRCIQELLRRPGQEVFAGELYTAVTGNPTDWSQIEDTLVDERAIKSYREDLDNKRDELACLPADTSDAYRQDLEHGITSLDGEIRRGTGLGGKLRPVAGERERARKRVGEAIRRALKKLEEHHRLLERHLRQSLDLGERLCYRPEQGVDWEF